MLIVYFDEVKFNPPSQPYLWLGALVVDADQIFKFETAVEKLAIECFGIGQPPKKREFHASELVNGRGHFEDWDHDKRIKYLKRLIDILGSGENLGKIIIRVDPTEITHPEKMDADGWAFNFLIEKVDAYLGSKNTAGILIGDRDDKISAERFADYLVHCRANGTPYAFGKELKYLIDTVHFTSSHHSRMLQLADLYVWLEQVTTVGKGKNYVQKEIIEYVRKSNILFPSKYKIWPPEK
jgi:hypothetical protein